MATRPKAVIESHDGEKLSPITIAKNVLTDDGQNLQDILSDRKEDMMTPTIENSSSMFKVGQGDNVDYSDNVVDGAYESMVLKGKSMVNCIQEPSSQDVVLPYAFEDGQYVTINDTKESGALGVELKGQTLVNVHGKKAYGLSQSGETIEANKFTNIVKGENQLSFDMVDGLTYGWGSFVSGGSLNLDMLKPNTKYLVYFATVIFPEYFGVSFRNGDGTNLISTQAQINKGGNYAIITTTNEIVKSSQILYISIPQQHAGHYGFKDAMIIEYQQGMETWDIPYFEGMASCKMPILRTVGKNLFDIGKDTNHCWQGITEFVDGRIKVTSTHNDGVTFHRTYNIPVEKGRTYCVNVNREGDGYWYLWKNGDTTKPISSPFTVDDTFDSVVIGLYCAIGEGNVCYFKPQIEKGTTATVYEPYKTSTLSLPEEVVLGGLGNTRDTFNTTTGKYTKRTDTMTVTNYKNSLGSSVVEGAWSIVVTPPNKKWQVTTLCVSDKFSMGGGYSNRDCGFYENPANFVFFDKTVNSADEFIAKYGDFSFTYMLEIPVVTKFNLPSTLKSWNTTTHIYSEIPENTLYPTLSHSNPTYPVIIKPSTKYSIVANSYSNSHTNSAINFNLGGATVSTTVGSRVTTITTPSTLSNELLTMSGRGNKLSHVMVVEGDVVGDEPYFEGICDCKSPILLNIGETILETPFEKEFGTDAQKEFFRIVDCAEIFDNFGVGKQYTLSLDIKANKSGAARIYLQNGSGSRHNFSFDIPVTTEYVRHTKQITPTMAGDGHNFKESWLACFTTYNTGCFATIKNIRISTGEDEPYKSNILSCETYFDETTQSDKTIVLRSLPNGVCDTLNVKTGEYVQNIGEVVLDGSEDWYVLDYPPHTSGTHYQFGCVMRENSIGGTPWEYEEAIISNKLPTADYRLHWNGLFEYGIGADGSHIFISWNVATSPFDSLETLKSWLQQNPVTVQYELATPIVKQVNVEGFPYAYENGHILLESGSQEQSLTPTIEYSIVANRGGQIRSNQRMVERQQKELDRLQAMVLANLVNTQYEQTLTNLKYDLKNVREEVK